MFKECRVQFSTQIFRMLCDTQARCLAIELRKAQAQELAFAVIDLQTSEILMPETTMENTWRVGLSAVEENVLLLHTFTESNYPDNKGLIGIDYTTATILWDNPHYYFDTVVENKTGQKALKVSNLMGEKATNAYLHLQTGEVLSANFFQTSIYPQLHAQRYTTAQAFFGQMKDYLASKVGETPTAAIDYLEWHGYFVIGYFTDESNSFLYKLLLFDEQKEMITTQIIQDLSIYSPIPFMVMGTTLLVLENLQTIKLLTT
jgi:hypothetical protein